MDFNLSVEHQLLSSSLRRYLADNYHVDTRNGCAYEVPYHSPEAWSGLVKIGLIGAFLPEDQGGFGGGAEDVAVIFEELGRGLCAEPVLGALLGLRLLAACGRSDLSEAVIAGNARVALAVYEPHVVCDLNSIEASANRVGETWHLRGRKSAVYGAPGADHVLVAARIERSIGLFLVEKPALIAAAMVDGGGIADIVMDDLPAELLSCNCASAIGDALDLGRIALCAEAVGAAGRLIDLTIDYLKQRKQFGRVLSSFQALQHRVVDMTVELEQCRSITIAAVASYGAPDQARLASMAKNLIGRMGTKIAEEAIQLHGGIGMTWEYPGSHYAKRLVMIDHQLGDRNDHLLRLMGLNSATSQAEVV
ncbi:acyl-CoA dehydrogenase family protein [Mesorhizobium sp. B4-1-4]|uniref:acyl-CoA dehydrogenase family protein n=1 Tax=Mesorhizobium sp. B4-1-4 TaxID=2589888 RepID=UPI0011284945|nr:acyl-CoA dehydrogenase family protein [Mesorhizobium sp. B4-1-4]UCI31883.1 acyl-CoA dehydrogenase family protein [Mesorhizobium sp. B4-1-4]